MLELLTPLPTQPAPAILEPLPTDAQVTARAAVEPLPQSTCISNPETTNPETTAPAFVVQAPVCLAQSISAQTVTTQPSASSPETTTAGLLVPVVPTEMASVQGTSFSGNQSFDQNDRDQAIAQRQRELEVKLAEIVARDRQQITQSTEDQRITQAMAYAQQGNYSAARRQLADPNIPLALRNRTLGHINTLEATSMRPANFAGATTSSTGLRPERATSRQPGFILNQPAAAPDPNPGLTQIATEPYPLPELPPPLLPTPTLAVLPDPTAAASSEFRFPLPAPVPITSGFGWRRHPILGDRRMHRGTDLGAPHGTPVVAAFSGRVTTARSLRGYGLTVIVEHESGAQDSLYAHLSEITVRPGQWVQSGAMLGRVGSTGLSTGPHLHFELRQRTAAGWQHFDPGPHLRWAMAQLGRPQPPAL